MNNRPPQGVNVDVMNVGPMNQGMQQSPMMNGNSMNQGMQQNPMMNGNSMNQGMQQNPMMNSNSMNQGMQQNSMMNGNSMNQGMQQNSMMNGNSMNQGMQQNPMMNSNSMMNSNPMNQGPRQNSMMSNNMMMNPNMGVNQSFGALRQDPTPSGNNPMQPMMNNPQTGARQDFLGVNAMTNTPVDLDGPTQLTPGKPVIMPEVPSSPSKPDISIKPKYNNNIKIIIIGGLLAIAVICLVLVLICYKTVTCTSEDKLESQGVTVYTTVKSYFWLGEIDKIVTEMVVDISELGPDRKSEVIDYYSDLEESDTKVKVNGDEIILIKTIRPESDDETDISPDEFKDAYTDLGLTCK